MRKTIKMANYRNEWINKLKHPNIKKNIKLCSYVKNKECIDCKKPTIKFNRCRECYYIHMGWDKSRLLGKRKQEVEMSQLIPSARMKELAKILTDSAESFSSDGRGDFKFPISVTEKVR